MGTEALHELARYIEANAERSLPLALLAQRVALSPARLQKRFKAQFGVSPKAYQDAVRLRQLKQSLREGERVTDAIYQAGYGSASRAYGGSRELGMPLKRYRAGGAGERISHAGCDGVLGPLLMAATDRGVCFAQFGDSQAQLQAELAREFPRAQLQPADRSDQLQQWLQALEHHLRTQGPSPELPLDLRGTAFQLSVWRFLTGLQRGATLSYAELAQAVGRPRAVRAAAGACARNRVAILVPCHRVLRGDGSAGGYRWGIERKQRLLAGEAKGKGLATAAGRQVSAASAAR